MYLWRKMDDRQRADAEQYRRLRRFPKHSPPHFDGEGKKYFHISAACFEHKPIIGQSPERMTDFSASLLETCVANGATINAWCVLPNHYHLLLRTENVKTLRKEIGKLHGRTSYQWNKEENSAGRQVWHNCVERGIKSERHYFATLNYVLNNPVHHGYCERWQDWIWSNARQYLEEVGKEMAAAIWREYPILDYGKTWDIY